VTSTIGFDHSLVVDGVSHSYGRGAAKRRVLSDVSFALRAGATLAVVGESGAGKSTLARIVAGLETPSRGRVEVDGRRVEIRSGTRSPVQMVFQDPVQALNRFTSIGTSVAEPLRDLPRRRRRSEVARRLDEVGIAPARMDQPPHAFSGGQLQRVVLARALAGRPEVLVCDEPTSALDVSVQAQIINLLLERQSAEGFACILVTHDLGVARVLADDVLVLRHGAMVELAAADDFFGRPSSEYSRQLLRSTADQMLTPPSASAGRASFS
jgi:ABC-type dipeptide/oligopeptide/nickel transport system ATPase subunit